jgi:hypothetical protein
MMRVVRWVLAKTYDVALASSSEDVANLQQIVFLRIQVQNSPFLGTLKYDVHITKQG